VQIELQSQLRIDAFLIAWLHDFGALVFWCACGTMPASVPDRCTRDLISLLPKPVRIREQRRGFWQPTRWRSRRLRSRTGITLLPPAVLGWAPGCREQVCVSVCVFRAVWTVVRRGGRKGNRGRCDLDCRKEGVVARWELLDPHAVKLASTARGTRLAKGVPCEILI